ncbi:MAG: SIS domain-containing protein [Terricaulis sp.]
MSVLGYSDSDLTARGAGWTASEITQQPAVLRETFRLVQERAAEFARVIEPIANDSNARIIFTGAGTSSFIGECLAAALAPTTAARIEAIATTDIVARPREHLNADTPVLLVSFGRSGSSPESVAAVDLADLHAPQLRHLAITCNADGELAQRLLNSPKGDVLVLPEATNDRSFAMTSSFTCMLLAGIAIFRGAAHVRADAIADAVQAVLDRHAHLARTLSSGFDRFVYLGSGPFRGLAQEAALKLLELTDGACVSMSDTPLGFRHGPKTILNERTIATVFVSNDPLARRYDLDLLEELQRDGKAGALMAISAQPLSANLASMQFHIPGLEMASEHDLLIPYIIAPQMLAFFQSLRLGKTPDNPNPAGTVSRVVKGVRIHVAA